MEELDINELLKTNGGIRLIPPAGLGAMAFWFLSAGSFVEGYNDATK